MCKFTHSKGLRERDQNICVFLDDRKIMGKKFHIYYVSCDDLTEEEEKAAEQGFFDRNMQEIVKPRFISYQECEFEGVQVSLQNNKITELKPHQVLLLPFQSLSFECSPSKFFRHKFNFDLETQFTSMMQKK